MLCAIKPHEEGTEEAACCESPEERTQHVDALRDIHARAPQRFDACGC
jgi:hypothetical protein